ncbi:MULTISPECIES: hypothetical protein [unclassified Candidatus Frackibacter]|uniref:hypothetical protein n=1 Tax=unclassified Candidatus Frackibacter TaxID=2648818 RepID=UPI00088A6C7B|nr:MULTISPECIES: hypothetical protein [unclassified Candidatus Frackibacter]SDC39890.1 hypothetical protein SAMN04515661_10915 [Candidatus Frackibacter sp. WG11]SEM60818.1 hypothetical protein SAMN04488698_108104 [Candidatus Frackibacter sp. WG12]SFL61117.1 hypothetical protein SAMN04488699_10715 [Candidatus Frackibacter sp. WG13]
MKKIKCSLTLILVLSILVVPVHAKDINVMKAGTPNAKLDTSALKLEAVDYKLGLRSVSVDGNKGVYNSDINLDDGLRLLNLDATFVPTTDKADRYLDLARFSLGDVGDPTPTYELKLKEYGLYNFGVKRSERDYVYENGADADHHTYDFTRTQDSMHLTITPEGLPKFFISKRKLDREGISVLTKDLYETHAEFLMNTPINETSQDATVGTEFSYAGYDFYLAHTQDSYTGSVLQEPAEALGTDNIGDKDGQYQDHETRSLDRGIDQLKVHKIFNDRFDVTLSLKDARGDGAFSVAGYIDAYSHNAYDNNGNLVDTTQTVQERKTTYGNTNSDSFIGSMDTTLLINKDTYLHSGYKSTETENNIDYFAYYFDNGTPNDTSDDHISAWPGDGSGEWKKLNKNFYNQKDKYYVKGEHYLNNELKAEVGYLYTKEKDKGAHGPGETTEDGYQLGFLYNPIETVKLDLDYKDTAIEEEGTEIADNEEIDFEVEWEVLDNLKLTSKYRKEEDDGSHYGAYVGYPAGHYEDAKRENEIQTFSVNYQPVVNLDLGLSYSDQTFEAVNGFNSDGSGTILEYTTKVNNDLYNVNATYQASEDFSANFYGNYIEGQESVSNINNESFKNEYTDFGLNLTKAVPIYDNLDVTLDLRRVEYDETPSDVALYGTNANDYSADIITLGLEGGF